MKYSWETDEIFPDYYILECNKNTDDYIELTEEEIQIFKKSREDYRNAQKMIKDKIREKFGEDYIDD